MSRRCISIFISRIISISTSCYCIFLSYVFVKIKFSSKFLTKMSKAKLNQSFFATKFGLFSCPVNRWRCIIQPYAKVKDRKAAVHRIIMQMPLADSVFILLEGTIKKIGSWFLTQSFS